MSIDNAAPSEWTAIAGGSWARTAQHKYNQTLEKFDEITKPAHYNNSKFETIDVIIDTLGEYDAINYCHGNVLKYTIRMWHKGDPIKDAKKAQWYLNKMVELLEKTKGVNW